MECNHTEEERVEALASIIGIAQDQGQDYFERCAYFCEQEALPEDLAVQMISIFPFAVLLASESDRKNSTPEAMLARFTDRVLQTVKFLRLSKDMSEKERKGATLQ